MTYTEIKERNERKYYYRVLSVRNKNKIDKKRTYLGVNLDKKTLSNKESEADTQILKEKIHKNISKLKNKIIKVLKKYSVKRAGIFGSYVRGEQNKDSDIDIIIEPSKNMGFEFVGLEMQLKKALKKKVDLVSYNGLSPYLKDNILNEEVKIL